MKNYLVAERYARALDRSMDDDSERDTAAAVLLAAGALYRETQELSTVLANPALPVERRAAILDTILERAGAPLLVKNLLRTLLMRGRIDVLPDVARLFAELTDQRLDRAGADITTAVALSDAQAQTLVRSLETYCGKQVRASFGVDPELLGGVIARIEGKVIDGSLRSRIQRLKDSLLPEEKLGG